MFADRKAAHIPTPLARRYVAEPARRPAAHRFTSMPPYRLNSAVRMRCGRGSR